MSSFRDFVRLRESVGGADDLAFAASLRQNWPDVTSAYIWGDKLMDADNPAGAVIAAIRGYHENGHRDATDRFVPNCDAVQGMTTSSLVSSFRQILAAHPRFTTDGETRPFSTAHGGNGVSGNALSLHVYVELVDTELAAVDPFGPHKGKQHLRYQGHVSLNLGKRVSGECGFMVSNWWLLGRDDPDIVGRREKEVPPEFVLITFMYFFHSAAKAIITRCAEIKALTDKGLSPHNYSAGDHFLLYDGRTWRPAHGRGAMESNPAALMFVAYRVMAALESTYPDTSTVLVRYPGQDKMRGVRLTAPMQTIIARQSPGDGGIVRLNFDHAMHRDLAARLIRAAGGTPISHLPTGDEAIALLGL